MGKKIKSIKVILAMDQMVELKETEFTFRTNRMRCKPLKKGLLRCRVTNYSKRLMTLFTTCMETRVLLDRFKELLKLRMK